MEDLKLLAPTFPPGFRFYPTDEELIIHYLKNKVLCIKSPNVSIMADIHLYKFNPWDLPNKALFGESEWFFFSPRDRLYPNGSRPNRTAASGYWKATGTDKSILSSEGSICIGVKKVLVFYTGRPPKGKKTDWMMYEYRLLDKDNCPSSKIIGSMRLDDWVLCRIRQKNYKMSPTRIPNECYKSSQLNEDYKGGMQHMDFNLKDFDLDHQQGALIDDGIKPFFMQGGSKGDILNPKFVSPSIIQNEMELSHFLNGNYGS